MPYQGSAFQNNTVQQGMNTFMGTQQAQLERQISEMEDVAKHGVISPYAEKYMNMFDGLTPVEARQVKNAVISNITDISANNVLNYFGYETGEKLLQLGTQDRANFLMRLGQGKEPPNYNDEADLKIKTAIDDFPNKKVFTDKELGGLVYPVGTAYALRQQGAGTSESLNAIYNLFIDDMRPGKTTGQVTGWKYLDGGDVTKMLDQFTDMLYQNRQLDDQQYYNARVGNAILGKSINAQKSVPQSDVSKKSWLFFEGPASKEFKNAYPELPAETKAGILQQWRGIMGIDSDVAAPVSPDEAAKINIKAQRIAARGQDPYSRGDLFQPPVAGQPSNLPSFMLQPTPQPTAATQIPIPAPVMRTPMPTGQPQTQGQLPYSAPVRTVPAPVRLPAKPQAKIIKKTATPTPTQARALSGDDMFRAMLASYNQLPSGSLDTYNQLRSQTYRG